MIYRPTTELLALNEADRMKWAEALESGKYSQCNSELFNGSGYCCLGVWERINGHTDEGLSKRGLPTSLDNPTRIDDVLPQAIWVTHTSGGLPLYFPNLNDTYDFSFAEIAQLLRGNEVIKDED